MSLSINGVPLDDPQRVFIVAEAAGSHCQDFAKAEALVQAAAEAGASAIKFQTIDAAALAADVPILTGHDAAHDAWIARLGVTRMPELFAQSGLPRDWHAPLKDLAESLGLVFMSTPFSLDAAHFLVEEVGVHVLKIASGDLTFHPLITYAASTDLPVIVSTGGATLEEVQAAARAFGLANAFARLVLLHCRSVYPCPDAIVNLRAITTLADCVPCVSAGFSDHTLSVEVIPALAVAQRECCVVEKHLRLEDDDRSVDAQHSLSPSQFKRMVEVIRSVPGMLGDGAKEPHALELHDVCWARRGADGLRPTQRAREGAWE